MYSRVKAPDVSGIVFWVCFSIFCCINGFDAVDYVFLTQGFGITTSAHCHNKRQLQNIHNLLMLFFNISQHLQWQ